MNKRIIWFALQRKIVLYAKWRLMQDFKTLSLDLLNENDYVILPDRYAKLLCARLRLESALIGITHTGGVVYFTPPTINNQSKKIH